MANTIPDFRFRDGDRGLGHIGETITLKIPSRQVAMNGADFIPAPDYARFDFLPYWTSSGMIPA